jgi:dTDP-4-amino-4,6-dideoxygalactose transaminase
VDWLQLPFKQADYVHGYQSYVCLFQPETPALATVAEITDQRNTIMAALEADGIVTRQGTHAAAHLDYYVNKYGIRPEDFPNAYLAERLTITLPLYAGMTPDESQIVAEALQRVAESTRSAVKS